MLIDPDEGDDPVAGLNPKVDANAAALEFLASLTADDPLLAGATLASEIDDILGRQPDKPKPSTAPPRAAGPIPDDDGQDPSFGWYAQLLGSAPALDDEYIFEAARRVEAGLFAGERLGTIDASSASRRELSELHTLKEEGEAAWEWMMLANLRLVFHWSKGVARSVDPDWAQDAFQVGFMGLMRGLQGWDHTLGYKPSTFVSWHIRQAIQRWRANDVTIIRVPVHVWEALGADESTLAATLERAAQRALDLASIEAMQDRAEDVAWDGGFDALEERIDRDRMISELTADLDERSRDILERRFGLRDDLDGPMTLDDIGDVWGVTRERIRQLEKKILDALKAKAAGAEPEPINIKPVRRRSSTG